MVEGTTSLCNRVACRIGWNAYNQQTIMDILLEQQSVDKNSNKSVCVCACSDCLSRDVPVYGGVGASVIFGAAGKYKYLFIGEALCSRCPDNTLFTTFP